MPEDPKALDAYRFYDQVLNKGQLEVIDELMSADFVEHIPFPDQAPGPEGVKQVIAMLRTAFPISGPRSWSTWRRESWSWRCRGSAAHTGRRFLGIPATGRQVSFLLADISRVRDGQFIEHWGFFDQGALMEQLGVTPEGAG